MPDSERYADLVTVKYRLLFTPAATGASAVSTMCVSLDRDNRDV